MKIALRVCFLSSTLDSPENFSSTAFHSPCNIRDDFILIFHKLKLVTPSNFGSSYFADDVDTLLDAILPQINAKSPLETRATKSPFNLRPKESNKSHGHKLIHGL